jgi:hypothetical protein
MTTTRIEIHAEGAKISAEIKYYNATSAYPGFAVLRIAVSDDTITFFMGVEQAREFLDTLKVLEINTDEGASDGE